MKFVIDQWLVSCKISAGVVFRACNQSETLIDIVYLEVDAVEVGICSLICVAVM